MTLRVLSFLGAFLFLLSPNAWGQSHSESFHQLSKMLTLQSTSSRQEYDLGRDSFVRSIDAVSDIKNSMIRLRIVDDYNRPINDETYLTSRKYYNKAVAIEFNTSISVKNEAGEKGQIATGTRMVRLTDDVEGANPKEVKIIMVNEEGDMLDWEGNPTESPPILNVNKALFSQKMLDSKISELIFEHEALAATGDPLGDFIRDCIDMTGEQEHVLPLEVSVRPQPRPNREAESEAFWTGRLTPYEMVMSHRGGLKGKRSCLSELRNKEQLVLQITPWGDLSVRQRAEKVYETAKESFASFKAVTADSKVRSAYANSVNPEYRSPVITAEVAACIAYQETSGHLNPFSQNYSYCDNSKGMVSTAHGLGQMTRTTFRKMKSHPEGDQMPYNTPHSAVLQGKNSTAAHAFISTSPHLQMEVVLRTLNFEAKHARWKNPRASDSEILKMAITRYDHDNKSKYVKRVFEQCVPCMKKKSAGACYDQIWD